MSKILTLATLKDAPAIYRFVKLLALAHGKDGSEFRMSENRFVKAFSENFFDVHLYKENDQEIKGIMLHMKEYSSASNGFGAYFDEFFLDPTLRGKGIGRKMLSEFCEYLLNQNQTFVKIIYHKNLSLDSFYNHFGFLNYSDVHSLYLYEGINCDLQIILGSNDPEPNEIVFEKIPDHTFPVLKITIKRDLQTYSFCCQLYFNSWSSFGLLFTDFTGDTFIARLSDFKFSSEKILNDVGWDCRLIKVIWWHVLDKHSELGRCIESCDAENVYGEGWKISYLNEDAMKKLCQSTD